MRSFAPAMAGLALVGLIGCSDQDQSLLSPAGTARWGQLDATQYEVIDLGTFSGSMTEALEIDKHGTAYGRYLSGTGLRSFRWTDKEGFEDLGGIDGQPFLFFAANDHGLLNGQIATGPGGVLRPVAWRKQDGFFYIDGENVGRSGASNDRGAIAGTRGLAPPTHRAFLWTSDDGVTLLPLHIPGETISRSAASDVNNHGSVAGDLTYFPVAATGLRNRAYLWSPESGTSLIPPLGPGAVGVTYVSDDDMVIGASETRLPLPGETRADPRAARPGDVPVHAWKWSAAKGLVDLGTLGGSHSVAWSVDADGNVYGWASDGDEVQHAVKWTSDGVIVDLGTLGGDSRTGGLNKHGVVAGASVTADGETHAVLFLPRKE